MSVLEEQTGELEVLQSIYEGKLCLISQKPPYDFEIELNGHAIDDPKTAVSCTLYFKYVKMYPKEAPIFEIRNQVGVSELENKELVVLISDIIQRSLGTVMVFDIVSEVQVKLDELTDKLIAEVKTAKDKQIKSFAEAEREREAELHDFAGTRVTIESFNAWNKAFLAEMEKAKKTAEEAKLKKAGGAGPNIQSVKRLTGKEMFMRDDQFDDSDLKFLAQEGGEIVEIDEKLFVDIGDIELSDMEDDDLETGDNYNEHLWKLRCQLPRIRILR